MRTRVPGGWLWVALALSALPGCGYMVGQVHHAQIRTVSVPVFETDSFRRGVEFQLTEAVQREILRRTPYRLAKDPFADTRLTGRIVNIRKDVLGESSFDDPRELQLTMAVEVTWEDLRSGEIIAQERIRLPDEFVRLRAQAAFAPEVGQSLATATQEVVDRMARQIVDMMEAPW